MYVSTQCVSGVLKHIVLSLVNNTLIRRVATGEKHGIYDYHW